MGRQKSITPWGKNNFSISHCNPTNTREAINSSFRVYLKWIVPAQPWAPAAELLVWFGDRLTHSRWFGALLSRPGSAWPCQPNSFLSPPWLSPSPRLLLFSRWQGGGLGCKYNGVGCWASLKPLLVEGRQQKHPSVSTDKYVNAHHPPLQWGLVVMLVAHRTHKDMVWKHT